MKFKNKIPKEIREIELAEQIELEATIEALKIKTNLTQEDINKEKK